MTNKPMLSVELELLESMAAYVADSFNPVMRARALQLRALLDADKVNSREMGLMQYVEAHPIKPATQHQGEPVACVIAFREGVKEPELLSWNQLPAGEHRLYAEPPSPVAITKNCCGSCPGGCVIGLNGVKP